MEVGEAPRDADEDIASPPIPTQAPLPAALTLHHVSLQCGAQVAARHVLSHSTSTTGFGALLRVTQNLMCPTNMGQVSFPELVEY